jgi:hypothetical protein
MRNVSDKSCREKHTFYAQLPFMENSAFDGIMWKNMVEPDTPQIIQYGSFALHAG